MKTRIERAEEALKGRFAEIDAISLFNEEKVLSAFREERVALRHFAPSTGYGYGDEGLIQIHNLDRTDGHRLLCLKISVADCMVPWLSTTAEYLDFIDLRLFQGSLREYIQETNPDTVAVIYQSTSFEDKNLDVLFAFD